MIGFVPVAHSKDLGVVGHDRVCDECSFCTPTSLAAFADVVQDRPADLESLLRRTNPEGRQRFQERLRMEAEVAGGRLTPDAKAGLLAETILCLDPHLRKVLPAPLDRQSWMFPLGTVLGGAVLGTVGDAMKTRGEALAILGALAVVAGGFGFLATGIRAFLRPAFVRRKLTLEAIPLLVRAWAPLRPTRRELEKAILDTRASGSALAKVLDVERLHSELPGNRGS